MRARDDRLSVNAQRPPVLARGAQHGVQWVDEEHGRIDWITDHAEALL
jgi:hypothetical protein